MSDLRRLILPSLFVALVTACLTSRTAVADIYKCNDTTGLVKYQNFPCSIDSVGSSATVASVPVHALVPTQATLPVASRIDNVVAAPKLHTLKPLIPTGDEPNGEEPYPGESMSEVRSNWGAPKRAAEIDGVEIWYYDGPNDSTRGVRFDGFGRVIDVVSEDWRPGPEAN